ncbi:MAG: DUF5821 family protein [Halobacteriales archaeon]
MSEEFVAPTIPALFDRIGPTLEAPIVLADPSAAMLRGFLAWGAADPEAVAPTHLLAREGTLKSTLRSFPTASLAADLVEADRLEVRYVAEVPTSSVVVDPARLYVLLEGETRAGALSTTDDDLVADVRAACLDRFEGAEAFVLHTPGRQRVLATLENRLGADRRETFEGLLAALDADDTGVDEVVISLLVAARHRDLLYDISKWGEDVGLASKATFSRKKSDLEAAGLLDTEAEPIDVGRPRLRLLLADWWLESAEPAELLAETADRLAEASA